MSGKIRDYTGQVFNQLTVLSFDRRDNGKTRWNCQCNCGKIKSINIRNLKNGTTVSCGCFGKKQRFNAVHVDLTGRKVGFLTILSKKENSIESYICECECGKILYRNADTLRNNNPNSSCGCKFPDLISEDLTGRIFNRLTVLFKSKNKRGASHSTFWICKCECYNFHESSSNCLKNGLVSCGCYFNEINAKQKGENHPCWNPNITDEERQERKKRSLLPGYRDWSKSVKERDNWTCQITGVRGGDMEAHHILNWKDNKDKGFNIENGITMTEEMHTLFHSIFGQRNTNEKQIEIFKKQYIEGKLDTLIQAKREIRKLDKHIKRIEKELNKPCKY